MDRALSTVSIDDAEINLGSVRRTALLALQQPLEARSAEDLRNGVRSLIDWLSNVEFLEKEHAVDSLQRLLEESPEPNTLPLAVLDAVAAIESQLFAADIEAEDLDAFDGFFGSENDGFSELAIDKKFAEQDRWADEELLDVFRNEANGLLNEFEDETRNLTCEMAVGNALWKLKRIVHTLKGAAGAVGNFQAAEIAHEIEDYLDAGSELPPVSNIRAQMIAEKIEKLRAATIGNSEASAGSGLRSRKGQAKKTRALNDLDIPGPAKAEVNSRAVLKASGRAVMRVSIEALEKLGDRIDELVDGLAQILERNGNSVNAGNDETSYLRRSVEKQIAIASQIRDDLRTIRLVEFGTLSTRLQRAVRVACDEVKKTAEIAITNSGVRLDTVVLDALVEPLLHLLRNAVVHGLESTDTRRLLGKPEKGLIRIDVSERGDRLSIRVSDDGRGIDTAALIGLAINCGSLEPAMAESLTENEKLELIFEGGLSTAKELSLLAGRGVGMKIVREAIEALGGKIKVHSRKTVGTAFTIELPTSVLNISGRKPERHSGLLIITVDDSESVRAANRKLIESCGHSAITTQSSAETISLLEHLDPFPDLIITDIEMPEMDGFELIRTIRADKTVSSIPVAVLSTRIDPVNRDLADRVGAIACIEKPLSRSKLETIISHPTLADRSHF